MSNKEEILYILKSNKLEFYKLGVNKIGLFGSCLRNENKNSSDIDILIDFETNMENFDNFMSVYDLFEKLFSKYKIDLVTKNSLDNDIGKQILKEVEYV